MLAPVQRPADPRTEAQVSFDRLSEGWITADRRMIDKKIKLVLPHLGCLDADDPRRLVYDQMLAARLHRQAAR